MERELSYTRTQSALAARNQTYTYVRVYVWMYVGYGCYQNDAMCCAMVVLLQSIMGQDQAHRV